ncbi:MAG TPA: hypothetical protein VG323_15640 [Thermoanaerobaculia bacterium]|nr:hypothetical protein [Thermoanaerobaculia bacterium]
MFRRLTLLAAALLAAAPLLADPSPLAAPMRDVEHIRGLRFEHEIRHVSIGRNELPSRIQEQMRKSMPYSFDDYMQVLRAMQLVDGKTDALKKQLLDLYQSQVLAFYDPLDHVYYSIREMPKSVEATGLGADAMRDMVVIHELTHALQDQRFAAGAREATLTKDGDGEMAFHALLEGEATLVMMAYMLDKMGQPLDALVQNPAVLESLAGAADKTVDPAMPRYFVESLKFPYMEGLRLCIEGYRRGGWKELDKMDANPPRSTREVLHSGEYFARLESGAKTKTFDNAAIVTAPGTLTVEHLGEFHWRYLVGAKAATGWVDDRVQIAKTEGGEPTVLAETRWNSEESAKQFRDAYVAFLQERGVKARAALDGGTVRVAYGADAALIAKFLGS